MSKIFDALRKAEQEPNPLAPQDRHLVIETGVHPRDRRVVEREFGSLSSAIQSYFPKAKTGKVILVVGCTEREGVTYVVANLGRTLATTAGDPVLCLDAKTGQVIWGPQRIKPATYSSSPVLADDKLYVTNEEGLTTVLKAGPKFEVLAENDLNDYTLSSPARGTNRRRAPGSSASSSRSSCW